MRKVFILIIGVVSCLVNIAKAQDNKFFIGYGFSPKISVATIEDLPKFPLVDVESIVDNTQIDNNFTIGYQHRMSSLMTLSISYTQTKFTRDWGMGAPALPKASIKNISHTVFVSSIVDWFKFRNLSLYSRLGVGMQFVNAGTKNFEEMSDSDKLTFDKVVLKNTKQFAYQASPIGVEWQFLKFLSVFAEAGVGVMGTCCVGITAGF